MSRHRLTPLLDPGSLAFVGGRAAERAVAIDPNQYAVYYTLSQIERRLGNEEEADRLHALFQQMAAARGRGPARTGDP